MTDAFPPKETIDVALTLTEDAVSRRRFLQLLGGAAGAVAVSGTLAVGWKRGRHRIIMWRPGD